jgi:hypothetical protein
VRRSAARLFASVLTLSLVASPLAGPAGATTRHVRVTRPHTAARLPVGPLGVIPVNKPASRAPIHAETAKKKALEYHGGPVMLRSTTYVINWEPVTCGIAPCTVESGYYPGIDTYFTDAAADSGTSTNVYSTLNQYYMIKHKHRRHIHYDQTFAASVNVTDPFPVSGCTPVYGTSGVCLTDAQVRAEVKKVINGQGWTGGKGHAFFLTLPSEVDTCFNATSTTCAFTEFCAYHSAFSLSGGTPAIYANIPYAGTAGAACAADDGSSLVPPNTAALDATLNATSHEHREMTNDPFGTGWWDDQSGNEGSDQCAYTFGTTSNPGGPNNGDFNQTINSNKYLLQEEWSNKSLACKKRGA